MRATALYQMLFGITVLIVGITGYAASTDYVSLVGGIVIGLYLVLIGLGLQKGWRPGLYMALVVALLLLGFFGREWLFVGGGFYPAALMAILSLLSVLFIGLVLIQPKERKREF